MNYFGILVGLYLLISVLLFIKKTDNMEQRIVKTGVVFVLSFSVSLLIYMCLLLIVALILCF